MNQNVYTYEGSLTTPPCSEIVTWVVINDPQPITADQLKKFTQYWADNANYNSGGGNIRPPQPLNDRIIYRSNAVFFGSFLFAIVALFATLF